MSPDEIIINFGDYHFSYLKAASEVFVHHIGSDEIDDNCHKSTNVEGQEHWIFLLILRAVTCKSLIRAILEHFISA